MENYTGGTIELLLSGDIQTGATILSTESMSLAMLQSLMISIFMQWSMPITHQNLKTNSINNLNRKE